MAEQQQPTFQIPKEIIEPIIKAHVNEAVMRALDGPGAVVAKAISTVLTMKVRDDGSPDGYNSTNSPTFIDWCVRDCIKKAARAAIEEELAKHTDRLKASMVAEMQRKNSPLIKQLADGLIGAITHPETFKWRLHIQLDEKR